MRGEHHDRYGHADAWYGPPAPPGADDVDAWATSERYRWAAALFIEGESRREERIDAGAAVLERYAERHGRGARSAHRAP